MCSKILTFVLLPLIAISILTLTNSSPFLGWYIFFTEFIFLQFTELHELIKESDKHQICTKKAAGLEAEASF